VQRQQSEACNVGEHIDDGAEGDAKLAHAARAYAISAAKSSIRQSRESFAPQINGHRGRRTLFAEYRIAL
jgi:hypothetical protein